MNDYDYDNENEDQDEHNSLGLLVQREGHGLINVMAKKRLGTFRAPGRGSRVTRG